jgi:acyl-CoA thioesterase I
VTTFGTRATPILLLLLAIGVGCRSSQEADNRQNPAPETSPVTAPQPVSTVTNDTRPAIVAFGDSLTAGYGADQGDSYPDYLQKLLDTRNLQYRVVNMGISGNTTKDGVERLKDVLALKPAIVIVEFGGNDGLRGLPIKSTRDNLDAIVHELKQNDIPVVLAGITLPPNYGPEYVAQFNKTYVDISERYKVPMIPFLLKGVFGEAGSMQADGIHATAKGNQQVAKNVLDLLNPLLKKTHAD